MARKISKKLSKSQKRLLLGTHEITLQKLNLKLIKN